MNKPNNYTNQRIEGFESALQEKFDELTEAVIADDKLHDIITNIRNKQKEISDILDDYAAFLEGID